MKEHWLKNRRRRILSPPEGVPSMQTSATLLTRIKQKLDLMMTPTRHTTKGKNLYIHIYRESEGIYQTVIMICFGLLFDWFTLFSSPSYIYIMCTCQEGHFISFPSVSYQPHIPLSQGKPSALAIQSQSN